MFVIFVLYFCVYVAAVILKILSPLKLCVCLCVCVCVSLSKCWCHVMPTLTSASCLSDKTRLRYPSMPCNLLFSFSFSVLFFPPFLKRLPKDSEPPTGKERATHTHTHTQGSGGCLVTLVPRGCLPSNLSQMWRIENHVWPSEILLPSWTRPPRPTAGRSLLPGPAEPCPLGQTATDLCQLQTHTNAV